MRDESRREKMNTQETFQVGDVVVWGDPEHGFIRNSLIPRYGQGSFTVKAVMDKPPVSSGVWLIPLHHQWLALVDESGHEVVDSISGWWVRKKP